LRKLLVGIEVLNRASKRKDRQVEVAIKVKDMGNKVSFKIIIIVVFKII